MKKIISIIGARPQFIKAKPVIDEFKKKKIGHLLVHTGQHYDYEMSKVFFEELGIDEPDYNLGVGSHMPGRQTGIMTERIETVLSKEAPGLVMVYGDTNSTLAGALAAAKLAIPVAHVEAGLRSFDRAMPEEINRVLTDHVSEVLFCPTRTAVRNLAAEGVKSGVFLTGDTMYDAILRSIKSAARRSGVLPDLGLEPKGYILATIHRQSNADCISNLRKIFAAFARIKEGIVLPLHPRTGANLKRYGIKIPKNVMAMKPVGYLDMLMLEKNARLIMTDSGGVQKESYWLEVPCVTLRTETEWVETVVSGWNVLAGCDTRRIVRSLKRLRPGRARGHPYGDGNAAKRIVNILKRRYSL